MKYKCLLCGQTFEIKEGEELVCPICGAKGDVLVLVEEKDDENAKVKETKES